MIQKIKQWLPPSQETFGPFRMVFTVMYIGIISSIIYFNVVSLCGNRFLFGDTTLLLAILLLLLALERFEQGRYEAGVPVRLAVGLLVARMALFEGVAALDCSGFSRFLYPVIPFTAYFSLGPRVSNILGIFYFGVYVWGVWLANQSWYTNMNTVSNLLTFTLILIFMMIMARIIRQDERSRRHTEKLLADLETSHLKLQAYAAQVAELATMEERNRLARDIHDSLGHYLTAINIQLEKALAFKDRNPQEAEQAIWDAKQSAREALQDVRRSVGALRDVEEAFSLQSALRDLVAGLENGRFTIDFHITGQEEGYSKAALMALYRAAQEGLTNIRKHAQARHVHLEVELGEEEARLKLSDDGQGFDTTILHELAAEKYHSFGLQGIRERLELVRGRLEINSAPQTGTELRMTVPKNPLTLSTRGVR